MEFWGQMVEMEFLEQMGGYGIFGANGALRESASVIGGFGANGGLRCKWKKWGN